MSSFEHNVSYINHTLRFSFEVITKEEEELMVDKVKTKSNPFSFNIRIK